jgi:ABC-type methionine transport system ATPase subunit
VKTRTFHLTFPEHLLSEPLLYRIHPEFDLVPNIRRANIEERAGWVILDLDGSQENIDRCLAWLERAGVTVAAISEGP